MRKLRAGSRSQSGYLHALPSQGYDGKLETCRLSERRLVIVRRLVRYADQAIAAEAVWFMSAFDQGSSEHIAVVCLRDDPLSVFG